MKGSTKTPKIFISYSWSFPEHESWVVELAERLSMDGVRVVLDKWDLKEGQDLYHFMEQMVKDEEILKVLVVSDKHYQKKADERKGGVGTESQLISKEVYDDVNQEKFIPVIKEKDENGKPCLPAYMKSRIYIDLSDESIFEQEYEKMLRNIYGKPQTKRPSLGVAPAYLLEEEPIILKTGHKTKQLENLLLNTDKNPDGLILDYFDTFLDNLEEFRISKVEVGENLDELVVQSIQKMLPLRDDFIKFANIVFRHSEKIDNELFKDFFERLIAFQFLPENHTGSHFKEQFDNYYFFIYELFLHFIATLLNLKKYKTISYLVNCEYFYSLHGKLNHLNYAVLNRHCRSLDEIRKNRLNLNRISITADLIKERTSNSTVSFDEVLQIDLLLYYLSLFNQGDWFRGWFPRTSVYIEVWGISTDFFARLISKKHCEKVLCFFDVKNIDELKEKLKKLMEIQKESGHQSFDYRIPFIGDLIKIEEVSSVN